MYGVGGIYVDWFTAAILQFYLFFPILYFLVKKAAIPVFVLSVVFGAVMLGRGDLTWQQYCFTDRIPAFLMGIAFRLYSEKKRVLKWMLALSVTAGVAVVLFLRVPNSHHFRYALFCPLFIYALYLVVASKWLSSNRIWNKFLHRLKAFGESSLETYYGNGNANIALKFCSQSYVILFVCAILTILYSYIFHCVSKEFKRILK